MTNTDAERDEHVAVTVDAGHALGHQHTNGDQIVFHTDLNRSGDNFDLYIQPAGVLAGRPTKSRTRRERRTGSRRSR